MPFFTQYRYPPQRTSFLDLLEDMFNSSPSLVISCFAAAALFAFLVNWKFTSGHPPPFNPNFRRSRRFGTHSMSVDDDSDDQVRIRFARKRSTNNNVHDSDSQVADDESELTNVEQSPSCSPNSSRFIVSRKQKRNRKPSDPDSGKNSQWSSSNNKKLKNLRCYQQLQMSDEEIYQALLKYVHHQDVLRDNCFPIESSIHPGYIFIYQDKQYAYNEDQMKGEGTECDAEPVLNPKAKIFTPKEESFDDFNFLEKSNNVMGPEKKPDMPRPLSSHTLSPTATEFVPKKSPILRHKAVASSSKSFGDLREAISIEECSGTRNKNARECLRCGKTFFVSPEGVYLHPEKCIYHWGKFKRAQYRCCYRPKNFPGCSEASLHVWKGLQSYSPISYFNDFVTTNTRKKGSGNHGRAFSVDAEMVFTAFGLELVRLTMVGLDGRLVYEAYVLPEHEIIDYNTRFSGLNAYTLNRRATKTLKDVQKDLLGFVTSQTILIGHGLENDLRVLKLVHSKVIDTAIVFMKGKFRKSLKSLVKSMLHREIQASSFGHDSFEDASACMELMLSQVGRDRGIFVR